VLDTVAFLPERLHGPIRQRFRPTAIDPTNLAAFRRFTARCWTRDPAGRHPNSVFTLVISRQLADNHRANRQSILLSGDSWLFAR
jgi:hypothetical protein